MKTCSKCCTEKELSEFYRDRRGKDGYTSDCKACRKAQQARYYSENAEQIKARVARYRRENPEKVKANKAWYRRENAEQIKAYDARYQRENAEKIKAKDARYRRENAEKIKAQKAQYYSENAEELKAYQARWRRKNPGKVKALYHRRRARQANAEGSYTAEEYQTRLEFFGHRCVFCGTKDNLTVDHLIPLSRGGSNHPQNLAPACHSCNARKGAKTAKEFFEYLASVQNAMHEGAK